MEFRSEALVGCMRWLARTRSPQRRGAPAFGQVGI
jgi:hypothetical protein